MVKNPSIDLLRGLLILLVMAGHAMELAHQNHVMLWIGGGFRMPMMFGLSGYLLNVDRTRNEGAASLFGRYANRMLLPWAMAVMVYTLAGGWPLSLSTPLELLLRPPFHLWYVPVLFFLIVMTRLVPLPPLALLAIGTPISLATMYSFGLDHGPIGVSLLSPDNRYLRYPVYFFFGMLVAERGLPIRYLAVALLAGALGLFWWIGLYGSSTSRLRAGPPADVPVADRDDPACVSPAAVFCTAQRHRPPQPALLPLASTGHGDVAGCRDGRASVVVAVSLDPGVRQPFHHPLSISPANIRWRAATSREASGSGVAVSRRDYLTPL